MTEPHLKKDRSFSTLKKYFPFQKRTRLLVFFLLITVLALFSFIILNLPLTAEKPYGLVNEKLLEGKFTPFFSSRAPLENSKKLFGGAPRLVFRNFRPLKKNPEWPLIEFIKSQVPQEENPGKYLSKTWDNLSPEARSYLAVQFNIFDRVTRKETEAYFLGPEGKLFPYVLRERVLKRIRRIPTRWKTTLVLPSKAEWNKAHQDAILNYLTVVFRTDKSDARKLLAKSLVSFEFSEKAWKNKERVIWGKSLNPYLPYYGLIQREKDHLSFQVFEDLPLKQMMVLYEEPLFYQKWEFKISIILALFVLALFLTGKLYVGSLRIYDEAHTKTEFVNHVSHELKSPLTAIKIFSEMLLSGRSLSPAKVHQYHKMIAREAERLISTIENLLDFSRIEMGKRKYIFSQVQITEILREAIERLYYQCQDEELHVHFKEEGLIPFISGDREALLRVFHNLLLNAYKYSPHDKNIFVSLKRNAEFIETRIEDRGLGIPTNLQKKIFDQYYRIKGEQYQKKTGTGLGLTLVQHTLEAHQGRIKIESSPGHGSTFILLFPVGYQYYERSE